MSTSFGDGTPGPDSRGRRPGRAWLAAALALLAGLAACSGEGEGEGGPAAAAEEPPEPELDAPLSGETHGGAGREPIPEGRGSIAGTVLFEGAAPERKEIAMGSVAGCSHGGDPVLTERLIVEGGRLQNVVVRLRKGVRSADVPPPPEKPAVLSQEGCVYRPHVLALQAGRKLVVENGDNATHNVNARPRRPGNPAFNRTQPAGTPAIEVVFGDGETFPIGCDLHPWMKAWVAVVEHPWFAVSGPDGSFAIEDVPSGRYELEAWHEELGRKRIELTVRPGETAALEFTFAAR